MRRLAAGAAAVLALVAGGTGYTLVPAAESPALPIAGTAPTYGPGTVAAVPNAAAIVRRLWSPGLDAGYNAQGLAVFGGTVLVAAYRSGSLSVHRGPCRVFRLDPASGAETGHADVPSPCGHAGGLAVAGGTLYVADTHTLFAAPLVEAFGAGQPIFRAVALGPGVVGGLAASDADTVWLGTYNEHGPGRLYRFAAATLAGLHDGDTLGADQATVAVAIPDYAQGAAFAAGALWIARSGARWGTLDRLDPRTGAVQHRYGIAPGTEGIAVDAAGRLWAVSEAGVRHYYDHPLAGLVEPFFPLVFALDLARLR